MSIFTVVDLFCGAGGLSTGLSRSGLAPIYAVDHFAAAVETYRLNFSDHVFCSELSPESEFPSSSVIAGGPPCQGFSSAGLRKKGDQRNSLVSVFAGLIVKHRPQAFIFENVEGFLTTEGGCRVLELLEPLIACGYQIHLRKVNAANFGVPQHRKRVIGIGGLGWAPSFPEPTNFAFGAPGAALVGDGLPPTPTLIESIQDLPTAGNSIQNAPVPDHFTKQLTGVDLERAKRLLPGQRMRDLSEELQHASYAKRSKRRVKDGTPSANRGGAPSGVRRLMPDEPSKAITAAARSEFLHPEFDRNLTLRECARIQTFDDDFVFTGTLSERATLIGNAVPPKFAQVIGDSLVRDLENARTEDHNGKLLSFVPTKSSGMSPALAATTKLIKERFGLSEAERQMQLW